MNRLDYVGIVVLIVGSFYPAVYYGFFCYPIWQTTYLIAITIAGGCAMYTVISPIYSYPAYRRQRTYVFLTLGLSTIVPVLHALALFGLKGANDAFSLVWVCIGGLFYVVGALLYAERVPECLFPGRFDLVGSSHQIFHVFILLAALSHYGAISEGYRYWHGEMGGVCLKIES